MTKTQAWSIHGALTKVLSQSQDMFHSTRQPLTPREAPKEARLGLHHHRPFQGEGPQLQNRQRRPFAPLEARLQERMRSDMEVLQGRGYGRAIRGERGDRPCPCDLKAREGADDGAGPSKAKRTLMKPCNITTAVSVLPQQEVWNPTICQDISNSRLKCTDLYQGVQMKLWY